MDPKILEKISCMSQLAPYALDELLEAYKRIWPGGRTRMFLSKAAAFYRILEARAEAAAEAPGGARPLPRRPRGRRPRRSAASSPAAPRPAAPAAPAAPRPAAPAERGLFPGGPGGPEIIKETAKAMKMKKDRSRCPFCGGALVDVQLRGDLFILTCCAMKCGFEFSRVVGMLYEAAYDAAAKDIKSFQKQLDAIADISDVSSDDD